MGGPAEPEGAAPVGLVESDVTMDPFSGWLAFADHVDDRKVRTWYDRCRIEPITPIDTAADKMVDLEGIARYAEWQGTMKPPRTMTQDEYPVQLEDQMKDVERQFTLRNLERVEKIVDPDEPMPFSSEDVRRPTIAAEYAAAKAQAQIEPLQLLETTNLDAVKSELAWRKRFMREIEWGRFFGAEVAKNWDGPQWKYDPDAPREVRADDTGGGNEPDADDAEDAGADDAAP